QADDEWLVILQAIPRPLVDVEKLERRSIDRRDDGRVLKRPSPLGIPLRDLEPVDLIDQLRGIDQLLRHSRLVCIEEGAVVVDGCPRQLRQPRGNVRHHRNRYRVDGLLVRWLPVLWMIIVAMVTSAAGTEKEEGRYRGNGEKSERTFHVTS